MKRFIQALALISLSTAAFAGPPVPSVNIVNTPLPVDVVTSNVVPLTDLGPAFRRTCDASQQCEYPLSIQVPIALYEVHFSPLPTNSMAADGLQCWVRVGLRQGLDVDFTEIAKFVWPANDLHGSVHTLAFPVGLEAIDPTTLRLIAGHLGDGDASCPIEVKIYSRKN